MMDRKKSHDINRKPRFLSRLWRIFKLCLLLFLLACIVILGIDKYISWTTKDAIYTDIQDVPYIDVGLVPGTSKYIGRTLNTFYTNRIDAAIDLYNLGKVKSFILSGDNAHRSYNEPWTMKRDLLRAEVKESDIYLDYAGFRTLDSVVRAREIFQADHFLIITQRFHCERAIFIAQHNDIEAYCLAVPDPQGTAKNYIRMREVFARTKAFIDLYITNAQPRFLGPAIPILFDDEDPDAVDESTNTEIESTDSLIETTENTENLTETTPQPILDNN